MFRKNKIILSVLGTILLFTSFSAFSNATPRDLDICSDNYPEPITFSCNNQLITTIPASPNSHVCGGVGSWVVLSELVGSTQLDCVFTHGPLIASAHIEINLEDETGIISNVQFNSNDVNVLYSPDWNPKSVIVIQKT